MPSLVSALARSTHSIAGHLRALVGQHVKQSLGGLQVHRHGGERVGEDVVDLAGDPGPLGERRRLGFRRVRPPRLLERLLGLDRRGTGRRAW